MILSSVANYNSPIRQFELAIRSCVSPLSGSLIGIDPQKGTITIPDTNDEGWLPVSVPGDVKCLSAEHGKFLILIMIHRQGNCTYNIKRVWYVLQLMSGRVFKKPVLVFEGMMYRRYLVEQYKAWSCKEWHFILINSMSLIF